MGGDRTTPTMDSFHRAYGPQFQARGTLYRFFDASDRLLYVGATSLLAGRVAGHRKQAKWWDVAVMCRMERYSTLREALRAEAVAIATEHPIHNIAPGMFAIDRP